MSVQEVTFHIDEEAVRAFNSASADEQRRLEALISIRLIEATRNKKSLQEIMSDISRKAQERGLTPEILKSILNEDE